MTVPLVQTAACATLPEPARLPDCGKGEFTRVRSLGELPPEVQRALGVGDTGFGGIAEPGQPFNSTDFIVPGLPAKRLQQARVNEHCVILDIEHGGFALRAIGLDALERRGGSVNCCAP